MIETVSDAAIEDITVDESARLVGVASTGRFHVYEIHIKEQVLFQRITGEPPYSAPP
ncbi:hypothetical protein PAXINDRAFT_21375 [Paxillus involutus ATCC 200175]|uniref:Uncharacterized protein n=1 Tax=Paxillus involutus ATCC 200175 TaxID=664439 RepID=A0A0C9TDM1_PAXIN|nr:hypothetical protein PAXINDRAFT_21375 [Paxillus involutus ATCC 200175]